MRGALVFGNGVAIGDRLQTGAASAHMLWAGTVSEPTKMAYWPSGLSIAFASKSIAFSPNALLSIVLPKPRELA